MAGGVDMLDAQHMAREAARPFSDIAVLCRTRRQLEQIETCLAHDSIPCVIYGRDAFLEDAAVQGALGFFASLTDPQDAPSLTACLTALWRVPTPLCQRAAAALSQSAGGGGPPGLPPAGAVGFLAPCALAGRGGGAFPPHGARKAPQAAGRAVRPCGAERPGHGAFAQHGGVFLHHGRAAGYAALGRGGGYPPRVGRGVSVRRGAADDAARRQGAGISRGVSRRGHERSPASGARNAPRRRGGGTQALFRRHHPRAGGADRLLRGRALRLLCGNPRRAGGRPLPPPPVRMEQLSLF